MKNENGRRKFMKMAALAAGTLVTFSISEKASAQAMPGTGGDAGAECPAPKPPPELRTEISNNHGHSLAISLAELKKNGVKSYSIQGDSGHPHTVDMTNEILLALFLHDKVEIETTKNAGHTHIVTVSVII